MFLSAKNATTLCAVVVSACSYRDQTIDSPIRNELAEKYAQTTRFENDADKFSAHVQWIRCQSVAFNSETFWKQFRAPLDTDVP